MAEVDARPEEHPAVVVAAALMHAAARQFLTVIGQRFKPESVLELGSCDVNGAVRQYFPTAQRYVGLDIASGPGVDVVGDAATWRPEPSGTFDLVVSSSLFEHTPSWADIVETAFWHCRPGGSAAFTTVMTPFPQHSARGGPLTDGEYYCDVTDRELAKVMEKVGFADLSCVTSTGGDVAIHAFRPDGRDQFSPEVEADIRTLGNDYQELTELFVNAVQRPSDINEHLLTMARLATELDAQKIIELGVRGGASTLAWLFALEDTGGHLWSVDIDPAPSLPTGRWTFVEGNDLDPAVTKQLPDDADIVFIDTSHTYEQTLAELNVYRWKVRPGGRIVLHDTEVARPMSVAWDLDLTRYPVKTAIEEFCRDEWFTWTNRPNNFGLGIIEVT